MLWNNPLNTDCALSRIDYLTPDERHPEIGDGDERTRDLG
jgi:hypothetical protein